MKTATRNKGENRNRGFATMEALLLLSVFTVLLSFALGMFGVIHSGILNSIAARTYAWETFTNRTNLSYFRDPPSNGIPTHFSGLGFRAHTVVSEALIDSGGENFLATTRQISDFSEEQINSAPDYHGSLPIDLNKRSRSVAEVNPVWVRTIYGICLNSDCGGISP
jgi:hypothetical protein